LRFPRRYNNILKGTIIVCLFPFTSSSHPMANVEDFEKTFASMVTPEPITAIKAEPIQRKGGFNIPREGFLEY